MHFPHLFGSPQITSEDGSAATNAVSPGSRRWRRVLPITAGATALVLAGGGAAFAAAHKTVTLDVDGKTSRVSTFAGSVDGVLAGQGIEISTRDAVSPTGPIDDGAQIVVRHAHIITISKDGRQQPVWTTALTADAALADLATRDGAAPQLVVSRSGDRAELDLQLAVSGPVDVLADGTTRTVPDGATDVGSALAAAGITLSPLDTVSVTRGDDGRVQVVVQRVVVQDVTTTTAVDFATQTVQDANAYTGTSAVRQAGVAGVRTVVDRVTTVDGVETARTNVSDTVTTAPVDQIVAVGTKAKPAPAPKPAPKPAPRVASPVPAAPASAGGLNWAALARCESGGRVDAVSANGLYYGLYQFSLSTWRAVGGAGLPSQASAAEQTARAQALYARSGAGQWPVCGKNLFS